MGQEHLHPKIIYRGKNFYITTWRKKQKPVWIEINEAKAIKTNFANIINIRLPPRNYITNYKIY